MTTKRFVWTCFAVAITCFGLATPASAYVRTDVVDETFVNVYLKWNDGKGTLSWSPDTPTEDDVASPHLSSANVDEFVGAPTPRILYINATKRAQLDLFLKSSSGGSNVEVYVGNRFYGGGLAGRADSINYREKCSSGCAHSSLKPEAPGYNTYSHRLVAELDVIPKGSIITLRILPMDGGTNVYGLSGPHGSVLRFPTFSADETLYRIPKYQKASQLGSESLLAPPPAVDDLVSRLVPGGGPVVGLATLGTRGRRRASCTRLVLLLLVAGCFAGCTSQSGGQGDSTENGPGLGGLASSYIVADEGNETGLTSAERGSIFGLVSDPEGLPVNGAFAALLGRSESARTDPRGRFHFAALVPALYQLHVDRDGFLALETTVKVEAASITKVDAVLEYASEKDRDHRPHRHDYWVDASGKAAESVVLFEDAAPYNQDADAASAWLIPPPLMVKPGTVDVEFNVTWPGGSSVELQIEVPDDPQNDTFLYPRPSGHAFHLRKTWEATDPGHSLYSYWGNIHALPLEVPCAQYTLGTSDPNCPMNAPSTLWDDTANAYGFHLRVTLRKGVVPLEPAHPDYWGERQTLPVIANQTQGLQNWCFLGPRDTGRMCPIAGNKDDSAQVDTGKAGYVGTSQRMFNSTWALEKGFVPFETQWLEVTLHASRSFADGGAPWKLFSRDAETRRSTSCIPEGLQNRHASREAGIPRQDPTALVWMWRIPLSPLGADAPYAKRSNWCFYVAPTDQNAYMVDDYEQQFGQGGVPKMLLTLSVNAHKDPMPKF